MLLFSAVDLRFMNEHSRALDKRENLMINNFFLFLIETICCNPSSEPSRQDGSDEGSQHMFLCRIKRIIPNYHQILICIYSSTL